MKNWIIAAGFILFLIILISDMRAIYNLKLSELSQESATCAINYKLNKCSDPVPLTEQSCKAWEICMNRDPSTTVFKQFQWFDSLLLIFSNFLNNLSAKSALFLIILPVIYLRAY